MAINNNLTSFASILAKLPQQKIAQAISLSLLIYIAFLAAKITWLFVPQAPVAFNSTVTTGMQQATPTAQNFNLSTLQALNLFGQYNKKVVEVAAPITDAPETRLQLTLSGLVASDKIETAAAIIQYQGKQETYGIGDVILGTRASLEQVHIDRVIIKQSGRLETLMLDGADYNQPAQNITNKKQVLNTEKKQGKVNVLDHRLNSELSQNVTKLRAEISRDPGKITDYLRIAPTHRNGKIAGYRLSPGRNPAFFKSSGLQSGDLALQMNGYNLLTPLEAAQALSALKNERDISLLVERRNELIEILFSID